MLKRLVAVSALALTLATGAAFAVVFQRDAVLLACRRVDQARRLLELPPRPGERRELGPNSARNLLEAQEDLVDAQNDLVATWVDYHVARLELLRDLELLDSMDTQLLAFQVDSGETAMEPGPAGDDAADDAAEGLEPLPGPAR